MQDWENNISNVNEAAGILDEYGDFIRKVIFYHVKDRNMAEDLYQEFFLSLVSKPVPPNIHNIKSYLYRAVSNDVIDHIRGTERYRELINKYNENLEQSINKDAPENAIIEKEQLGRMLELVKGRLTPTEAQAITLRYGVNCDIKEIAEKMNVNARTVSRYLSIGLGKLRRYFREKKRGKENDKE